MEKKEIVLGLIAAVAGLIYIGDYIANHWSHISIPIPQTNATSGYVTIRIPRVSPPLPTFMLYSLAGLALFGVIGLVVVSIYDEIKPRQPLASEPGAIIIEAVGSPTLGDKLRAFIEADRAVFNVSGVDYNDELKIRARASQLNILAAEAKGTLGSSMDMEDYIVNPDILMQQPKLADGRMKEIAAKLLGKLREHEGRKTKQPVVEKPKSLAELRGALREEAKPEPSLEDATTGQLIERVYGTAKLKLRIASTSDWFEVGLRDSRRLTIPEPPTPTKGKMLPLELNEDLAGSYFRIDHAGSPELEVTVAAIFEVPVSSVHFVFLRKGDMGKLEVEVLDERGTKLGEHKYSRALGAKNQDEFAVEYDVKLPF